YEGCRDLHQTRPVLATVSGGGRALREQEPPSFGPMQEGIRICFETPEDGQDPRGNHASGAPILQCEKKSLCDATWRPLGMESRTRAGFANHRRDFHRRSPTSSPQPAVERLPRG